MLQSGEDLGEHDYEAEGRRFESCQAHNLLKSGAAARWAQGKLWEKLSLFAASRKFQSSLRDLSGPSGTFGIRLRRLRADSE